MYRNSNSDFVIKNDISTHMNILVSNNKIKNLKVLNLFKIFSQTVAKHGYTQF